MPVRWRAFLPIVCLLAAIALVFGRLGAAQFVQWDDPDLVQQNPLLNPASAGHLAQFWREPFEGLYTPLAYTLWSGVAAVDPRVSPWVFHFLNIALHAGAAVFAFLLLRELVQAEWCAWAGAMVFALHPLQVEPVAWVSGMNNLLAGAMALGALWQYVLYAKGRGRWHLIPAAILYAAALLSKPTAVIVPLMAAALDIWLVQRPWRRVAIPVGVSLAAAIVVAIIARRVQPATGTDWPPLPGRLLAAADAVGFYCVKLFAPVNLVIDYERTPWWVGDNAWVAWPGLAILFFGTICLLFRGARWLRAGAVIFVAALLPTLGIFPFGFQRYSTVADRYAYLAMFGVALLVAQIMQRARGHMIPWAVCGIVLALVAARAFDQTSVWRDTRTLADQEFSQFDADNVTGHKILAAWLANTGENDKEAEQHFKAAIAGLDSGRGVSDGAVWFDYANMLERQGRYSEAITQYQQAIAHFPPARQALAYNNMGMAYYLAGDNASARQQFKTALALRPDYADARTNLRKLGG